MIGRRGASDDRGEAKRARYREGRPQRPGAPTHSIASASPNGTAILPSGEAPGRILMRLVRASAAPGRLGTPRGGRSWPWLGVLARLCPGWPAIGVPALSALSLRFLAPLAF